MPDPSATRAKLELEAMRACSRLLSFYDRELSRLTLTKREKHARLRSYGISLANVVLSAFSNQESIRSHAASFGALGMPYSVVLENEIRRHRASSIAQLATIAYALRRGFFLKFLVVQQFLSALEYFEGGGSKVWYVLSYLRYRLLGRIIGSGSSLAISVLSVGVAAGALVLPLDRVDPRLPRPVKIYPIVDNKQHPVFVQGPFIEAELLNELPIFVRDNEPYEEVLDGVTNSLPWCLRYDGGLRCDRVRRFCEIMEHDEDYGYTDGDGPGGGEESKKAVSSYDQIPLPSDYVASGSPSSRTDTQDGIANLSVEGSIDLPSYEERESFAILSLSAQGFSGPFTGPPPGDSAESIGRGDGRCYTREEVRTLCPNCIFPAGSPFAGP